jgi:hypothetical protein
MRKIYVTSFFIFVIVALSCSLNAQIQQKEINGEKYSYDSVLKHLVNNKNTVSFNNIGKECDKISVNDSGDSLDKLFKTVFSSDRISVLAQNNNSVTIQFFCNRDGVVINIEFFLSRANLVESSVEKVGITIEEIYNLEKLFTGYKFNISSICEEDVKYVSLMKSFRFNRL